MSVQALVSPRTVGRAVSAMMIVTLLAIAPQVGAQDCVSNCQDPDQADATASGDANQIVADNFTPDNTFLFNSLCWTGGYYDAKTGGDCVPIPEDDFTIIIYDNDAFDCRPDDDIGPGWSQAAGTIVLNRVATGNMIVGPFGGPITEYRYTASLTFNVALSGGDCIWLEITNNTDFENSGCQWMWGTSPSGDGARFVDGDGETPPDGYDDDDFQLGIDQSFCLDVPFNDELTCNCLFDNDLCVGAVEVFNGETQFTNTQAAETPDGPGLPPDCNEGFGLDISYDVYFCYTATCSGVATASFCDSMFDTRVAVYDGCGCPESNNSLLACNDDSCFFQSEVTWEVQAGLKYLIRVGTSSGLPGAGVMDITCEPINQVCDKSPGQCHEQNPAGATASGDGNQNIADDLRFAVSDTITSICWWGIYLDQLLQDCSGQDDFTVRVYDATGVNGGPGKLLSVVNQTNGSLIVTREPTGFLVLNFFPEYEFRAEIPAGIDVPGGSCLWLEISNDTDFANTTCQWLWEFGNDNGAIAIDDTPDGMYENGPSLNINDAAFCVGTAAGQELASADACIARPPLNDDCEDAEPMELDSSVTGSTVLATTESIAGTECGPTIEAPGVWYSVIGDGNGLTATTCNGTSNYDMTLHVFCATCEPAVCIGGNDDDSECIFEGTENSTFSWCSEAGATYLILISGPGTAVGDFQLDVMSNGTPCGNAPDCSFELPENDDCANAICVTDQSSTVGNLTFATSDGGINEEVCSDGFASSIDVWYSYTPTVTGTVTFDTCGSPTDTVLAVFESCDGEPGDEISCNDDSVDLCPGPPFNSELEVILLADTTYLVRVSAFSNQVGLFSLNVNGGTGTCKGNPCPWDLTGNGNVSADDLAGLLDAWGPNPGHPADFTGDGLVDAADLAQLLDNWGPCP